MELLNFLEGKTDVVKEINLLELLDFNKLSKDEIKILQKDFSHDDLPVKKEGGECISFKLYDDHYEELLFIINRKAKILFLSKFLVEFLKSNSKNVLIKDKIDCFNIIIL